MNTLASIALNEADNVMPAASVPELRHLVDRCLANDRSAQAQLYKKHYGKMMGLCMRFTGNREDALETLNDGFLKVFRNLDKYKWQGPLEAWIYRIVYNTLMDRVKVKLRQPIAADIEEAEFEPTREITVLEKLFAEDLLELLNVLPDATRAVFNLFAIDGYKHEEIAEMAGISTGTSKWHVNQARKQLQSALEKRTTKP